MIHYIYGDATFPERITPNKKNLIVHIVNDVGAWGAGFVLSISRRWTKPEYTYKANWTTKHLGDIDIIQVEQNIAVVNLFGQKGIRTRSFYGGSVLQRRRQISLQPPVRYDAIKLGLSKLKALIKGRTDIAIHMPKIGCGLAGGDWSIISKIIEVTLSDVDVYVYEF